MNHTEAVERAARSCCLAADANPDSWRNYATDVAEILVASGYPAALTEATALLRDVVEMRGHTDIDTYYSDGHTWCVDCRQVWPCPVERARVWLADHEDMT